MPISHPFQVPKKESVFTSIGLTDNFHLFPSHVAAACCPRNNKNEHGVTEFKGLVIASVI